MKSLVTLVPTLKYTAAALLGAFMLFGSTNVSLFEWALVGAAFVTSLYIMKDGVPWYSLLAQKQNRILLLFVVLVCSQYLFAEYTDPLFGFITVYLIGVYALVQFWVQRNPEIRQYIVDGYVTGVIAVSVFGLIAYIHTVTSSASNISLFWEDNVRISGFFTDPVIYGAFLVPAILILGTKAVFARRVRYYCMYTSLVLLVFCNLILTGARGAWLSFIVASIVLFAAHAPLRTPSSLKRLGGVVAFTFVVAIMIIFVVPINGRSYYEATLAHRYGSSDLPRIENIQAAPKHISDRPVQSILLGSGSGSYERTTEEGFSAHNTYLRIMYEQGIVGISIYCAFLIFALRRIYVYRRIQPLFASILCASLVGMLIHGLFVDTLHWRHFWVLAGLII